MNLKGRNFLTLKDFTPEEITYMIDLAAELKAKKKAGELHEYYKGKKLSGDYSGNDADYNAIYGKVDFFF